MTQHNWQMEKVEMMLREFLSLEALCMLSDNAQEVAEEVCEQLEISLESQAAAIITADVYRNYLINAYLTCINVNIKDEGSTGQMYTINKMKAWDVHKSATEAVPKYKRYGRKR